ncbi:Non-canonical purine NTP phosphatase [Bacillus sp. THAF10]|uniref:DUF84 family protein n=1 Tax=Bacillus sp. THAF10 TaxID=2587848 RepID=UPI0012693B8E|nr:DUF84 family protein [Bacillus sp. THAF10]QFT90241.1 Non-canonical purine NTP phosphatase [Bacillus sp. THAF10]
MKIVVGSLNPAKYKAVQKSIQDLQMKAETSFRDVDSGVSQQPRSDDETITGALYRARQALESDEHADLAIGLEGGVIFPASHNQVMVCNWGAIVDRTGNEFIAGGARIPLPPSFKDPLLDGVELGVLMDEYCQRKDVRKHEGAVGVFTAGAITRLDMFKHVTDLLLGQWQYHKK